MTAPVAINARAAVRREIGGVERVARELATRLPALHPGRYRVIAPRPALAHQAGHAWEQLALPVLARRSSCCLPGQAGPAGQPAQRGGHPRRRPLVGDWYGAAYTRWHRDGHAPRGARRRGWC